MEYKALYRKYRPDNFNAVVGQTAIIKTLQNIVKNKKISHAYLFNGPRGTGKTSVAKLFAKAINCLDLKDGAPCGKCLICTQINEERINDIIEIDAASNNGVDEIRELKSKVNLTPTVCQYKVYIVDEVHMLSIGAFNALLKTLEEPPHHAIFILATTEMHKLPMTIISRCQNFNFKKITEEQIKVRLKHIVTNEDINIDDNALDEIAKVSDGGMRDAIGLLEQLYSFTDNNVTITDVRILSSSISRDEIVSLIEIIINNDVESIFKNIDHFYQEGKDFIKIVEDLILFLKDILLYKKAKSYFKKQNTYDMESYNSLLKEFNENLIYDIINKLNQSISELKVSSHPKILFEILMLRIMDIKKMTSTEQEVNYIKTDDKQKVPFQNTIKEENSNVGAVPSDGNKMLESTPEIESIEIEEVTEVGKTSTDDVLPAIKLPLIKKILINNTLAVAEKELLNELKLKSNQLKTFLLNKDFKQAATILLDSKVVGVSTNNVIYAYPYDVLVEKADNLQDEIELLIANMTGSKYKVINITDDDWLEIRPIYVNLKKEKKEIVILPEIDVSIPKKSGRTKKRSKEIEDAITMFGEDLIEIK